MAQITNLDAKLLKSMDNNPRTISREQFEKLVSNIEKDPEFFQARPCLVNHRDGSFIVFCGNQRLRAAKKLKMKQIPCIVFEDLSDDIMYRRSLLDNVNFGEHDFDLLSSIHEVEDLLSMGLSEKDLHLAFDIDKEDLEKKPKKKKQCPNCGHEF